MPRPASADFIIPGDDGYLAPYDTARAQLPATLARLKKTEVIALRPQTLKAIEQMAQAKLDELEQSIATRRDRGFEAAAAIVRQGIGNETMLSLREQIGRLQEQQEVALERERSAADQATKTRTVAFTLATLANLLFIAWAYRRIAREMVGREMALAEAARERAEVQRQKDLLAVTLASIGDCVHLRPTKSDASRFGMASRKKLTGWTFNEAQLRPISDVFKIVNEFTRDPVANPVDHSDEDRRYRRPG